MRKIYSKPTIVFESFTLSEHIAGDCEHITSNPSKDSCGYITRGGVVFTSQLAGICEFVYDSGFGTGNNQICYHVPTEYNNLFNS